MTQSSSSNNASSSSSSPPLPPLQQFTLDELIRVLQNHRIEVISPHEQMQNEIAEQHQIERDLEEQRARAASERPSIVDPPTSPAAPAAPLTPTPVTATGHSDGNTHVADGTWTLFHTDNVPTAVLTGGSVVAPIPVHLIDLIIDGLVRARAMHKNVSARHDDDAKGKKKEEVDNDDDYTLVPPPPSTEISGFVCAKCKAHNLVRPASDSWYVVTVGREVGVFSGWPTVQPLVIGVRGSCFKKYKSEADAKTAFELAHAAGNVHIVP